MPPELVRRPRAVPGLICAEPDVAARSWLLGLIAGRPLDRGAQLPLATFAAEAPALIAALVDALGDDRALARLAAGGDRHGLATAVARMTGATEVTQAVGAVEELRQAVAGVLPEADRHEAHDRLAHVCATVAAAAASAVAVPELTAFRPVTTLPATATDRPWEAAIAAGLAAGGSLAVLLVEVDDLDRLRRSSSDGPLDRALTDAEATLHRLLPAHPPVREVPGRWWVVGPLTDAHTVGERLAAELASATSSGAVALGFSVGVGLAPADGTTVAALVTRAEEGVFAARAAGLPVA